MRPVRTLVIAVALIAVAVTGWALGRGGYSQLGGDAQPQATQAVTGTPQAPLDPAPQPPTGPDSNTTDDPPGTTQPAPRPRIRGFGSEPVLPKEGGFWRLPDSAGILTLVTDAPNATKVEFLLAPTGTEVNDLAVRIGQDTNGRDGWLFNWHYDDKPVMSHLIVRATGPGGTAEESVGIYRPDPTLEP